MSLLHRIRNVFRDGALARDIDREVQFHLRERADELRAAGVPDDEADRLARRQFGNPTFQRERTRDADVAGWLDSVMADLRYALRALRRAPAFAVVAIASLGLAIGATTAIWTLLDVVVLRPLPVAHPEELVQVRAGTSDASGYFSNPLWEQVRDRATGLAALAAFSETRFNLAEGGEARPITGSWVSGDYFRLFGVRPAVGRLISRSDDVRGCPSIAVLGHGFWQREFGGDAGVVGRSISLQRHRFTVVGVAAEGFGGPEVGSASQVFVPLCSEAAMRGASSTLDARSNWWLRVMGRREAGTPVEQVAARVAGIAPAAYAATVPPRWPAQYQREYLTRTLTVVEARNGLSGVRTRYRTALTVLMGAVALLLLIACANVANLLLARAAARVREVAIRLAIGAERRRLVRQLLTESAVLAALGALVGLAIAQWATRGLVALISTDRSPVVLDLSLNGRVLAFAALATLVTTVIFGLVPAWRGTRVSPQSAMKSTGRGVAGGHRRLTLARGLVAAQVALSLVLLTGAGLLVGSLARLTTLDPGFEADGVLIADVNLRPAQLPEAQLAPAHRALLDRVRGLPGVRGASITSITPVAGNSWNDLLFVDGFAGPTMDDSLAWFNEVSEGHFATMGTRLLAGRDFGAGDTPTAPRVAIVTDAMARRFYGDASPLGRTFRLRDGDRLGDPITVVGVVENSKYLTLREEASAIVYLAATQAQHASGGVTLVVRGDGDPMALAAPVKAAVAAMHPAASIELTSLERQLASSLSRERMLAVLSATFGGVALFLSMLGLYGVMAYSVARRRNEIGVRIALGATRQRVLRLVLGDVGRVVTAGVVVGLAGAIAAGRLVTGFLYGVRPTEPGVLALAVVLLGGFALLAGFVPAARASRMDPVESLREE